MIVRTLALLLVGFSLVACETPRTENLFNTGRDARVYNPATGRYEWPGEQPGR
jgi:hypothetical protein